MTVPDQIVDTYVDGELRYEYDYGNEAYLYMLHTPFVVDGIEYDPMRITNHYRPIIDVFDDHLWLCECVRGDTEVIFSRPLTEEELDRWVREGKPLCI